MMVPAAAGFRFSRFVLFFLIILAVSIPVSCGIEDYPYLEYVEPSEIYRTLNTVASIRLPTVGSLYFQHFTIYYRIYISGLPVVGELSTEQLAGINQALASDYNALLSYTNVDGTPTNMGGVFSTRKYYSLALENYSIDTLLGAGSLGSTIRLDFENGRPSLITGGGASYQLFRHSENNVTVPYADKRYFLNSADVNDGSHINAVAFENLDVQDNPGISGPKFTYVSMYILSAGIDPNFSNIYSIPTFIGVFLLPNE
jgi:hypothetical protein